MSDVANIRKSRHFDFAIFLGVGARKRGEKGGCGIKWGNLEIEVDLFTPL